MHKFAFPRTCFYAQVPTGTGAWVQKGRVMRHRHYAVLLAEFPIVETSCCTIMMLCFGFNFSFARSAPARACPRQREVLGHLLSLAELVKPGGVFRYCVEFSNSHSDLSGPRSRLAPPFSPSLPLFMYRSFLAPALLVPEAIVSGRDCGVHQTLQIY